MEVKPGYKQTEVGVIPEEWEPRLCSELSERIMVGIVIRPTQYYVRHGVPTFRSANIREDGISDSDLVFISEASNSLLAKSQTRTGDVLTVRTGYPGTSAVVHPVHAGCNCIDILITRPSKRLDSEYLAIWINSSFGKEQVLRNQGGLAQKHFNVGDMRNLVVALPSLPEQRAIATALSDVDGLLGGLDRLIAKKRDLKQAAMQQLLTGQTRLPGFHGEWEVKRLGDVAMLYQPVTISANQFTESGYPVYGANGVVGFYHDFNHHSWQVTVTCRGSTCGTVNRTVEKCWITGNAMVVGCGQHGEINKEFLYYVLSNEDLSVCITGTGQPQIVRGPLANVALRIPVDAVEQTAIAEVLTEMDGELAVLEQRREKTRVLKQAMMQELLTGKTRLV